MIPPEQFLKRMIESELQLDGKYIQGKPLNDVVEAIFEALFNRHTIASVRQVLADVEEQDK